MQMDSGGWGLRKRAGRQKWADWALQTGWKVEGLQMESRAQKPQRSMERGEQHQEKQGLEEAQMLLGNWELHLRSGAQKWMSCVQMGSGAKGLQMG